VQHPRPGIRHPRRVRGRTGAPGGLAQFKEEAYTKGIKVTTTILKAEQEAAYDSVRRNVLAYDQRHGYRGPEGRIELPADAEEREDAINEALQKRPVSDGLIPAVVLEARRNRSRSRPSTATTSPSAAPA
jgi:membrane carboxypeptidase/penicillin-binding protein